MPNIKQQEKRSKKDIELRLRNRAFKTQVKNARKNVLTAEKKDEAIAALAEFCKIVDTVAGKGVLHKNKAARDKSRLSALVAKIK